MKQATYEIRPVKNSEERELIYAFRYRIYIEEMHRKVTCVDHERKRITDELDLSATIFGVWQNGELVGTCSINTDRQAELTYCSDLYDYKRFERRHKGRLALFTKLMIAPELRRSALFLRFMREMYVFVLNSGVEVNLLDCNDHLVPVFSKMGFREYKGKALHKDYGAVTPMAMFNRDRFHLETIGSPLLCVLDEFESREIIESVEIDPFQMVQLAGALAA